MMIEADFVAFLGIRHRTSRFAGCKYYGVGNIYKQLQSMTILDFMRVISLLSRVKSRWDSALKSFNNDLRHVLDSTIANINISLACFDSLDCELTSCSCWACLFWYFYVPLRENMIFLNAFDVFVKRNDSILDYLSFFEGKLGQFSQVDFLHVSIYESSLDDQYLSLCC